VRQLFSEVGSVYETVDMSLIVRSLKEADHASWQMLWEGCINACLEQGIAAPPLECTDLNWLRLMSNEEPVSGLLAERDDKPVGLVHYIFHRSTFHAEPICYLQDINKE
jgi:hypothetical protein